MEHSSAAASPGQKATATARSATLAPSRRPRPVGRLCLVVSTSELPRDRQDDSARNCSRTTSSAIRF